jgi:hypothetical protein
VIECYVKRGKGGEETLQVLQNAYGTDAAVICLETRSFASTKEISHRTIIKKSDSDIVFVSKGIILQYLLPQKKTLNGVYYANTLKTDLKNAVWKKRPKLLMKR